MIRCCQSGSALVAFLVILTFLFSDAIGTGYAGDDTLRVDWKGAEVSSPRAPILLPRGSKLGGRISSPVYGGAIITVDLSKSGETDRTKFQRFVAIIGDGGQFEVPIELEERAYTVIAHLRDGNRMISSPAQTLLCGGRLNLQPSVGFAKVGTEFIAYGAQLDMHVSGRVPAPGGAITYSIVELTNQASEEPTKQIVDLRDTFKVPFQLRNPDLPSAVAFCVKVKWQAAGGGPVIAEDITLNISPFLSSFKLQGLVRQATTDAPNLLEKEQIERDQSGRYITTRALVRLSGRVEGPRQKPSLKILVTCRDLGIRQALAKANQRIQNEIKVPVAPNGTFDTNYRPERKDYDQWNLPLFPGQNTVTIEIQSGEANIGRREFDIELRPPSQARLWAWMVWNSDADMDLWAVLQPKNVGIYWRNPKYEDRGGTRSEMLSWGTLSGVSETFAVYDAEPGQTYNFFAKPDARVTEGVLREKIIKKTDVFLALWEKSTKEFKTDIVSIEFDETGKWKNAVPFAKFQQMVVDKR